MSKRTIRYLPVYVPARTPHGLAARGLIPGSGIVGRTDDDAAEVPTIPGWIEVYYEGNTIGAANIITYADRVYHAADRLVHDYPTTACADVPVDALRAVGTFDHRTRTLQVSDEAALATWLGFSDGRVPWHERRPSD